MGRAAPDRAPLPRGKGAGRSPKAGGTAGAAPAHMRAGANKKPRGRRANGARKRAAKRLSRPDYTVGTGISPVQPRPMGPQLAGFHRRWGLAPRPEAAPLYHAAPPGATLFCHARAAGRRGGTGTGPARPGGGADVRGTGRRPGTARHENRARAAICRAGPSFFAPPPQAAVIRRRRLSAGGGLLPQAAVCARLSTRCAGRSWCAGSRAPCGCRAFRGTSRRAP